MERIPALDGLRGIAIILVMTYHANYAAMPGGAVGVTLFFVLSGYLITRILVDDLTRIGSIRWGRFYWRRTVRLLPALLVFVGAFLATSGTLGEALPTLTYTANLREAASQPLEPTIAHTWSLAVEEHFYLIWPVVLAAIWKRRRLITGLVVLSTAWYFTVLVSGAEWQRIYFSSDTAAFALLIGCLLAFNRWTPRFPVLALATLVVIATTVPTNSYGYLWLMPAAAVAAAVAVAGAERIPSMKSPVLRWFGRRSYALYLWHPLTLSVTSSPLIGLMLALIASEMSWRLVETPANRLKSLVGGQVIWNTPPAAGVHVMSPPLGVTGRPVAESMLQISGDVEATPESL